MSFTGEIPQFCETPLHQALTSQHNQLTGNGNNYLEMIIDNQTNHNEQPFQEVTKKKPEIKDNDNSQNHPLKTLQVSNHQMFSHRLQC